MTISTRWPELYIEPYPGSGYEIGFGSRFSDNDILAILVDMVADCIYIYPKNWTVRTKITARPPSETLLELLRNHSTHKFDPPIYDCLLEEYPEIEELL